MKRPIEIGDNLAFVIIILIIMICCLLGAYIDSKAQTVVPNAILDTMIFEVKYARQCRITVDTLQDEIKKLEAELVANSTAIKLSQKSNETLSSLLRNSRDSQEIQGLQFQKDLKVEKRKTRKWRGLAIGEGLGLIGLLILIL